MSSKPTAGGTQRPAHVTHRPARSDRPLPDAIVVGAGVVGAACAAMLARDGLHVEVYDAAFAGSGATAEGMGHFVVMDDSEAQFALTAYSVRLLESLAPVLSPECEYDPCGTLWLAQDDAEFDIVRAKHAFYTQRGVDSEILDTRAVADAEPELARMAGALRVGGDRVVYPPAFTRWLLDAGPDALRELGGGARDATASADSRAADAAGRGLAGGKVEVVEGVAVLQVDGRGVRTSEGRRDAGLVVNAAGVDAPSLTPGLPVAPRKGHLVITERAPGFCRHQLVELGYLRSAHASAGASVAFNLQPRRTGQMLIGSSRELAGRARGVDRLILSRMIARAVDFTPRIAQLRAIRVWTGFRPATPDRLPLVGAWPEEPGLWIATGHEGLGITTALGSASLIADLVAGRVPAIDAQPFAPARALSAEPS